MTRPTDELRLVLANGRLDHLGNRRFRHQAFTFWREFWVKVLAEVDPAARLDPDDFYRQDRIVALMAKDEIVGMHLYSYFDLEEGLTREHSYFRKHFSDAFFEGMQARRTAHVMSLEYLSVSPEWRASRVGVSLARVIIGIGLRYARHCGVEGVIAASRADVGVSQMAFEAGAEAIVQGLSVHGRATDLIAWTGGDYRDFRDAAVNDLAERLWQTRRDSSLPANPKLAA